MTTWADTKGPVPGGNKAVRQHAAQAGGYELPVPERRVETFQPEGKTGETLAPGLTSRNISRKM